jgi:hypothetical protein
VSDCICDCEPGKEKCKPHIDENHPGEWVTGNPKDRRAQAEGKVPLHYLEPTANAQIAGALESGAKKYGYRNFTIEPIKATVYIDALLRHIAEWRDGGDADEDTGLHPLAHVGANVHVALAAIAAGKFIDDRGGEAK